MVVCAPLKLPRKTAGKKNFPFLSTSDDPLLRRLHAPHSYLSLTYPSVCPPSSLGDQETSVGSTKTRPACPLSAPEFFFSPLAGEKRGGGSRDHSLSKHLFRGRVLSQRTDAYLQHGGTAASPIPARVPPNVITE